MSELSIILDLQSFGIIIGASVGISTLITIIYNKGRKAGNVETCLQRIENDLSNLQKTVGSKIESSDETHGDLYSKIHNVDLKVTDLGGQFKSMFDYLKNRLP